MRWMNWIFYIFLLIMEIFIEYNPSHAKKHYPPLLKRDLLRTNEYNLFVSQIRLVV